MFCDSNLTCVGLQCVNVVFPNHTHLLFAIYNSLIASKFRYSSIVLHFCSASGTNKLAKVQERALRFINNDHTSSLNDLLKSTNTQPLHVRRIKQIACESFKIINKMSPEYI